MFSPMKQSEQVPSTPSGELNTVVETLFKILREMDGDALDTKTHEGLQWFGGSRHQAVVKNRWLREIRKRLTADGIAVRTNVALPPECTGKCDVLIECGEEKLWLKIVGIWKEYCRRIGMHRSYKSALFYPLLPNLESRTSSAANSLIRLTALQAAQGDRAGLLILGFDSETHSLDDEFAQFEVLARLSPEAWFVYSALWHNRLQDLRTSLRLWVKV